MLKPLSYYKHCDCYTPEGNRAATLTTVLRKSHYNADIDTPVVKQPAGNAVGYECFAAVSQVAAWAERHNLRVYVNQPEEARRFPAALPNEPEEDGRKTRNALASQEAKQKSQEKTISRLIEVIAGGSALSVLPMEKILERAVRMDGTSGLYILLKEGQVKAVEKCNLRNGGLRLFVLGSREFDAYAFVACEPELLDAYEDVYRHLFKLQGNGTCGVRSKADAGALNQCNLFNQKEFSAAVPSPEQAGHQALQ